MRLFRSSALLAALPFLATVAGAEGNPHVRGGARSGPQPDQAPSESGGHTDGDSVVKVRSEVSGYADTDHVSVFTPAVDASVERPTSGLRAGGGYLVDIVSAASVDIVSTASARWVEQRHAGNLSAGYKPGTVGVNVNGSVSREPDYLSLTGGSSINLELVDKTVNPTFAYAYSSDTAGRKNTPFDVYSLKLERHTMNAGVELILDPLTLLSFSVDAILERGHQEKPYRFLPIFSEAVAPYVPRGAPPAFVNRVRLPGRMAENLPTSRNRFAFSGRVAQRLSGSTLILSERVYVDDWGLLASTTDLRFVMDLSRRVLLWTHLRGHIQSSVSFWQRAYTGKIGLGEPLSVPKWRTGDREMSDFGAGTFGAGLRWYVGSGAAANDWSIVTQADMLTTVFNDTLFIQNRQGYIGVIQLEAEL